MELINILEYEKMVKLNLPESERAWIIEKATRLEESFDEISAIDTEAAEPLISVLNLENRLREDVSHKELSRDEILKNSPEQNEGYFQVPKTIE